MTLAHKLKPTATVHTADMDGWLRDKEGNRIRRWFTQIGEGGELRVWPPKLQDLHTLEKKRWEGVMKLRAWCDAQEGPMQEKLNALTRPLVGGCPDELGRKIILMRYNYTNPESRGCWRWYREEDHPPLEECGDGQELVNEWWYVIQRRRTIAEMAGAYHTAFTHVLDQRYMKTLTERATGGPLKWTATDGPLKCKAIRMTINSREYIFKLERSKYSAWIEFVILPEDLDVLVIPEVAK